MVWTIGYGGVALIVIVILTMTLRVFREYQRGVVFTLGRLRGERPGPSF